MAAKTGRQIFLARADADRIFAFAKAEWNTAAPTFIPRGWDIKFAKHDTGVHIIGFDRDSGLGFSLQPLFKDDTGAPEMVIVGNYFPSEQFSPVTAEARRAMEANANHAVSPNYHAAANTTSITLSGKIYEVIEFMVTKTGS